MQVDPATSLAMGNVPWWIVADVSAVCAARPAFCDHWVPAATTG